MTAASTVSTLSAEPREKSGKGVARGLRREGKVPAVLYGKGHEPMSLALSENEVTLQYRKGRFRSRIVNLDLNGQTIKALPHDVQFHPVTDVIEHVDFIKVDAGTTIRVMVPVKFRNNEKSVGLKRGGVLNVVRHEVELNCRPESIPASIEINVQEMDIGDSVHINSVQLPEGVTPVIKRNFTIATIAGRSAKADEEPTGAPAAAATPEATAQKKEEPAKK